MIVTSLSTFISIIFAVVVVTMLLGLWNFLYRSKCISEIFGSKGYSGSPFTFIVLVSLIILLLLGSAFIIFVKGFLGISFLVLFLILTLFVILSYTVGASMPFLT